MIIRFTKERDKDDTIACFREDGSATWERANVGVRHDLIHFVVETRLDLREAFYGLLAEGWAIQDFGSLDPSTGRKRGIPAGAGLAENIVMLLQYEMQGCLRSEDFETAWAERDLPAIAPEQLEGIRSDIRTLFRQWEQVPPGGHMELVFGSPEATAPAPKTGQKARESRRREPRSRQAGAHGSAVSRK